MPPLLQTSEDDLIDSFIDIPLISTKDVILNKPHSTSDTISSCTETTRTREKTNRSFLDRSFEAAFSYFERLSELDPCTTSADLKFPEIMMKETNQLKLPTILRDSLTMEKAREYFKCENGYTAMEEYFKEFAACHPVHVYPFSNQTKPEQQEDQKQEDQEGEEIDIQSYLERTKIFYHQRWCAQLKSWKEEHSKVFQTVLQDLMCHVHDHYEKRATKNNDPVVMKIEETPKVSSRHTDDMMPTLPKVSSGRKYKRKGALRRRLRTFFRRERICDSVPSELTDSLLPKSIQT